MNNEVFVFARVCVCVCFLSTIADRSHDIEILGQQEKNARESLLQENMRMRTENQELHKQLSLEKSKPKLFESSYSNSPTRTSPQQTNDLINMLKQSYERVRFTEFR